MHDDQKRVIDNNGLLKEKLSAVLHAASREADSASPEGEEGGFEEGLKAETVDVLFDENRADEEALSEEKKRLLAEIEEVKKELADLQSEADGMIENAKSEIGVMQMKAYEEAKTQGYQEGERLGREESDAVIADYRSRKKQLELEYSQKIEELEPAFVETLTGIYEHIFKVDLGRYRELVIGLLTNTLQKIDGIRNFMVHVSRPDYEGVLENKERLRAEAGGGNIALEIVEDLTLSKAQCYIETENGIYDCSLDTELKELERKLVLLSYEKQK